MKLLFFDLETTGIKCWVDNTITSIEFTQNHE